MSTGETSSRPALPDPLTPEGAAALRQEAEAFYLRQAQPQAGRPAEKAQDQERLIEELHIHQIELELQNQSLRATRLQLEESLNRYTALYSFAPIALLTLSGDGTIQEANQTAADLFGLPLSDLRGRRLGLFVSEATRPAFNDLLAGAFQGKAGCRRELVLSPPDQRPRWVLAEGIADIDRKDRRPQVQLALTDISDCKALEERLREQDELFRAILDNANDGISYLDLKTQGYLFLNPALVALSGFTAEDLKGVTAQQVFERIHPDDQEGAEVQRRRWARGQEPEPIQYRWRVKNGDYRWLSDSGKLVHDAQGRTVGLVGIHRDITRLKEYDAQLQDLNASLEQRVAERTAALQAEVSERERAQERLSISEDQARRRLMELEAIYATAPVGLAELDGDLRFRRINERLAAMNGYPVAAHLGRTLDELLPEVVDKLKPPLRRVLTSGEPLQFELAGETPAHPGEWRIWQEYVYPLRAPEGQVIGLNFVTEDITERKLAEENLRESERRFRDLFEHLPIAYQSVDREGRWLDANQKMADLLGFAQPEEMLGLSFVDYWDPSIRDRFEADFACFTENHSIDGELPLRRRDGTPLTVLIAGRVQRDAQGHFLRSHCILFDITERRAMEDEIRALNDDLELKVARRTAEARAASAAKSEFLAHMSHEIRTPLNAILGLAQVMDRESLDATQHQRVTRILEAGDNLLAILNDILDFSKIESGRLPIETQAFDLLNLLLRLDSLLGRSARAKGLAWRIDCPPLPTGALLGDPLRLGQVLTNLISNAIKFTKVGEVGLRITVQETRPDALRLRFVVEDSGIGIEPEVLAALFQPFVQGDASITRRFGGTGLGLVISKRLVELMGGKIGATSEPGRGSAFWCELPFRLISPAAPGADQAAGQPAGQPADLPANQTRVVAAGQRLAGWHLLVVDDSELNREVVEQALRLEGAEVTLASDGAEALERLSRQPRAYRAVLLDVQMPVMDGLTAARRIRLELGLTDLPIIALTAGALPHERQAALAAGMNEVLTKPVRLEAMLDMLLRQGENPVQASRQVKAFPAIQAKPQNEAFPAIPGIDRDQAREILCGNRALFLRLLAILVADSDGLVGRVREELARGQGEAAAQRLHSLKGNAGSLGALAIMALAGQLEKAVDDGETALDAPLAELDRQLRELSLASAPWLEMAPASVEAQLPVSPPRV